MLGFHPSLNRTARHRTVAAVLGGMVAMAACTSVGPPTRAAARFELTATGPLRAAFISGNRVQAARDPTSGELWVTAGDAGRVYRLDRDGRVRVNLRVGGRPVRVDGRWVQE